MSHTWQSQALYPKPATAEHLSFTGVATTSNALPKDCGDVGLEATQNCFIEIGGGVANTTTSHFLGANKYIVFRVKPMDGTATISVISDGTNGTLHISPLVS